MKLINPLTLPVLFSYLISSITSRESVVDILQHELQVPEITAATNQRAKISYEEELKNYPLPTFSRASRNIPDYTGRVRNYDRNGNCDVDCHLKRSLNDHTDLSYETLDVSSRTTRSTSLRFDDTHLNMDNMKQTYKNLEKLESAIDKLSSSNGRSKREVYRHDTRFNIVKTRQEVYPFNTVFKLSTGCSGIIIDNYNILTAAHCIHDGNNYVKGAKKLRVGRPRAQKGKSARNIAKYSNSKRDFKWKHVKRVHFPESWKMNGSSQETPLESDYAILSMRRPLGNYSPNSKSKIFRTMKLGVAPAQANLPINRLYFSNFDYESPQTMRFRFCSVNDESAELYYNYCDTSRGASGSGVYSKVPVLNGTTITSKQFDTAGTQFQRRITSVFSGHRYVKADGVSKSYNVAVKITPLKLTQICMWILKDPNKKDLCLNPEHAIYGQN